MKSIAIILIILNFSLQAALFDVEITNFKYTPNDLEINVGDTVRWTNVQGFHDVVEDNNVFTSGAPSSSAFVFEHTFNSVEEIKYYCTVHSTPGRDINANMNGRINVVDNSAPTFAINQGMAGAWFFPETSGSGILIDVLPANNFIFAAWFTYDVASPAKFGVPENRWFTAQGGYTGANAIDLRLIQTSGGIFDNTQEVTNETIGSMSIEFTDCNTATVSYSIDTEEITGTFPIQRVLAGSESLCEALNIPTK